ncbi:MAG: hypothetical protein SFU56_13045 [Capsulimonadales bacterium]|nr:hypothetical protein [Capsulimonadales bacterium]
MPDFEDARRIALSLPGTVAEETGFRVGEKGIAWIYMEKVPGQKGRVRHDDVLAVRVANVDEKLAMIAAFPDRFFTDDHYRGYPAVLVRLTAIDLDHLTELLTDAWRIHAPKKRGRTVETG